MSPAPTQQSLSFVVTGKGNNKVYGPPTIRTFQDYGVLWSASRPVGATVSSWLSLYGGDATNYPETSPYTQNSGSFFESPPINTGKKSGRRMMRLLIVDCPSTGGNCRPAIVRGVGKFFLQKKANVSSDKNVYVEYSGLELTPLSNADIRLYR